MSPLGMRALALAAALFGAAPVSVSGGRLRLPPPGVMMTAGYLELRNDSDQPVTVVGLDVDGATSSELHETVTTGGQARMVPLPSLVLPPHGAVKLAPGGKHLMVSLPKPPAAGKDVGVTVRLGDGRTAHGVLRADVSPR